MRFRPSNKSCLKHEHEKRCEFFCFPIQLDGWLPINNGNFSIRIVKIFDVWLIAHRCSISGESSVHVRLRRLECTDILHAMCGPGWFMNTDKRCILIQVILKNWIYLDLCNHVAGGLQHVGLSLLLLLSVNHIIRHWSFDPLFIRMNW